MFLDDSRPGFVKGVIKDFHFESLHHSIRPFLLFPEWRGRELLVKLSGLHLQQTIAHLQDKWKELVPSRPFEYHFLDEQYNQLYHGEIRLGKVLDVFAVLAVLLACMGLFGLSSYAAKQRTREIGIRKVLGATVIQISLSLSAGYLRLAAFALPIAIPFAWWALSAWLSDFAYKVSMNWGIFMVAGIILLACAALTVGLQSARAAMNSPARSLRNE
jgi:putative ABC transport system permease protein